MTYSCVDGYCDLTEAFERYGLVNLTDDEDNQSEEVSLCLGALVILIEQRDALRAACKEALALIENPDADDFDANRVTVNLRRALKGWAPAMPQTPVAKAREALARLIGARDLLKSAGAPKTLQRVRLAISSAKGAVRNADCKAARPACAAAAAVARLGRCFPEVPAKAEQL